MGHSSNRRKWATLGNIWITLFYTAVLLLLCIISWGTSSAGRAVSAANLKSVDFASTATPIKPKLRPITIFVTPPPVRTEEPLSPGNHNIPSVFKDIDKYSPIHATLTNVPQPSSLATDLAKAKLTVVKILGCDDFGCKTPIGSGVIVHPHGLILTAYHVLLIEPDEPTSLRYRDFVISTTENPSRSPAPSYKARLVAFKVDEEQDLAILAIDRTLDDKPVANPLDLRALPLADMTTLDEAKLYILGYPINGSEVINTKPTDVISFDDELHLITVDESLSPGYSGGPAVLKRENGFAVAGLVIRKRIMQGELSQQGLLRSIDQLYNLTWTRSFTHTWGEDIQAYTQGTDANTVLHVSLTIHTVDLIGHTLRLLFYAVDAATDTPWSPTTTAGPLVIWADIKPQTVIDRQIVTLTVPVKSLGDISLDQLRFPVLLWDVDKRVTLWSDAMGVQAIPVTDSISPTSLPTSEGGDTPTSSVAILQPTSTPTNTASPTSQPTATYTPLPQPTMLPEEALTDYFALIDQALTSSGNAKIDAYSIAFKFLSNNFIKTRISTDPELLGSSDFEKYQWGWENSLGRPTIQPSDLISGQTKSGDPTVTLNIHYAIEGGTYKLCYVLRQDERMGIHRFDYWLIVDGEIIVDKPRKGCA